MTAGNLIVSEASSIDHERYTFNQAKEDRCITIPATSPSEPESYHTVEVPGDAQYRQSPITFGKTKDLLHSTYTFSNDVSSAVSDYNTEGLPSEINSTPPEAGPPESYSGFFRDSQKYLNKP